MPDRNALLVAVVLLAAGLIAGCGGAGPSPGTVTPSAATTPGPSTSSTLPVSTPAASRTVEPPQSPGAATAGATSTPSTAWFEDAFEAASGWAPADPGLLDAVVAGGALVLRQARSTEPAYVWAPKDGPIGGASIEATIVFPAGARAMAGLAVADLDFAVRLVLLLEPDGTWRLQRDDATTLRTLVSGRVAAPVAEAPVRLRLVLEDGGVSAWVGDQELGRAAIAIDAGHVGLAAQSPADGDQIRIDDFRVTLTG